MKRILIATTMAASLVATNLFAAETANVTLAPGKPAGVQQAQDISLPTLAWVGVGVAGLVAFGLSTGQKKATGPVSTAGAATST